MKKPIVLLLILTSIAGFYRMQHIASPRMQQKVQKPQTHII